METEWTGWGVMFSGEEYGCRMMWEWGIKSGGDRASVGIGRGSLIGVLERVRVL
jgi:hypothetical protein